MANLKASKKAIQTSRRNHARNLNFKTRMKSYIRRAVEAIESGSADAAEVVKDALRIIDKTAAKGVIKKQTAARRKSRLSNALNKTGNTAAPAKKAEAKPAAKKPAAKKAAPKKPAAKKTTEKKTAEKKPAAKKTASTTSKAKPAAKKATPKADKAEG